MADSYQTGGEVLQDFLKSFVPSPVYSSAFVYYTVFNSIKTIEQCASGSTFKEVSTSVLRGISTLLPPSALVAKFSQTVTATFQRQDALEKENQHLTQLRDWLLPLLMNGQVTVA